MKRIRLKSRGLAGIKKLVARERGRQEMLCEKNENFMSVASR